jgi:hypothetical protein
VSKEALEQISYTNLEIILRISLEFEVPTAVVMIIFVFSKVALCIPLKAKLTICFMLGSYISTLKMEPIF